MMWIEFTIIGLLAAALLCVPIGFLIFLRRNQKTLTTLKNEA